jgi:NADPH:quinone reductase-like Zn-dependent oxidoreductase
MKASYLTGHGGPEVQAYGDLPDPVAGPGEVVVRLKAAALNHLDLWVRAGMPGLRLSFPHVLGGDGAGIVESVGEGVTGWKAGAQVIVHPGLGCGHCGRCLGGWESLCDQYRILGEHVSGTLAQKVKVPAANLFAKPTGLSFEQAAAAPLVFTTAWQMLVRRAGVQRGETVLVHAAGSGVGSAGLQIAKLFGARVIATAGSDSKLELARQLGADEVINYADGDWVAAARKLAPGGFDVVFDHLGKDFWPGNLRVLKRGGRLTLCGATTGWEAMTDLRHVFYRQLQILGSTMGSKTDFPQIVEYLAQSKLKAVIGKSFPLSQSRAAMDYLSDRKQFGKVILMPES